MKLQEFAESRNVKSGTISAYVNKHKDEFKGHFKRVGKEIDFDEIALKLLDKKYPTPKPIQVIEDTESREKLLETQQLVIDLQNKLIESSMKVALAEHQQALLESREQEVSELKDEIKALKEQLELEQRKTWWDKLRHR